MEDDTIVGFKYVLSNWATVSIMLACVACQPISVTKSISLNEAKKITAEFNEPTFEPPPRSTADVIAFLDQKLEERAASGAIARAAARKSLVKEPVPGLSGTALVEFYRDRGLAARKVGDIKSQIHNFQMAADLTADEHTQLSVDVRLLLGNAQFRGGKAQAAIQAFLDVIERSDSKGLELSVNSMLARVYLRAGDLSSARIALQTAKNILDEAENWDSWDTWGATMTHLY